jgi:hypothetical protein
VRGGDSSCGAETPCAGRKLVVLGGNLSEKPPPVGDLSGKPPTGQRQGILLVKVLTGLFSPPYAGFWPSHCQWCRMTPS